MIEHISHFWIYCASFPANEKAASGNDELAEFHAQKKKFKAIKKTMAKKGGSREEQVGL